jgi:hypothetical protein
MGAICELNVPPKQAGGTSHETKAMEKVETRLGLYRKTVVGVKSRGGREAHGAP